MSFVFRALLNGNLNDASGNGFTGTTTGAPTSLQKAGINGAYNVVGLNYINIPHSSSLAFSSGIPFSFGCRVKVNYSQSPGKAMTFMHKGRGSSGGYYHCYSDSNNSNTTLRIYNSGGYDATVSTSVNDGKWHEIIGTRDSSNNVNFWIDGKIVNTGTGAVSVASFNEALFLGHNPDITTQKDGDCMDKQIDDAWVDNTKLSSAWCKNYTAFNKGFI